MRYSFSYLCLLRQYLPALRRCGDPGTVSNGQRTPSAMPSGGYPVSSAIVYTCNSGYRLRGQRRLVCLPSLRWSTPVPICSNQCEDPGTPANGGRRGSSFTVGSTVVFSCQPTYQLIGSLQRRCGNDLQWSGTQPQCAGIHLMFYVDMCFESMSMTCSKLQVGT